jgi:hypothetical protein
MRGSSLPRLLYNAPLSMVMRVARYMDVRTRRIRRSLPLTCYGGVLKKFKLEMIQRVPSPTTRSENTVSSTLGPDLRGLWPAIRNIIHKCLSRRGNLLSMARH